MYAMRALGATLLLLSVGCGSPVDPAGDQLAQASSALSQATVQDVPAVDHGQWDSTQDLRLLYLNRFYRQFAHGKVMPLVNMLPSDMTWSMIGWRQDVVPFAGEYAGRQEIRRLFTDYFAAIKIDEYHFQYRLVDGNNINWHFRIVATVPMTGKTFDAEFVHTWQFDDSGKPVFCRSYYDTQLQVAAFSLGGATELKDLQNTNDDFVVDDGTPYDVQALTKQLYDYFYVGDIVPVLGMAAPDAYVYFKGDPSTNPQSGEYHTTDGVLQFIYRLAGTAVPYDITRSYVTEGDRCDVVLFENWTVPSTGKSYHVRTVNSWRVNADGKLMGFINYPDIDEVAAAYVP